MGKVEEYNDLNKMHSTQLLLLESQVHEIIRKREINQDCLYFGTLHSIKEKIFEHGRVEIRGFGTFEIKIRKGGKRRNPKTGETVYTKDHGIISFRPGKEMKQKAKEITTLNTKVLTTK